MEIRAAKPEDAAAIMAVWNPFIADTVVSFSSELKTEAAVREYLAHHAQNDIPVFVVEVAGQVEGFGTYGSFRAGDGYLRCAEHTIYLSPAAKGNGVGRQLMGLIEDAARARGIHIMVAAVASDNTEGVAFHKAIGYTVTAQMPEMGYKFGRYLDLTMLQKTL